MVTKWKSFYVVCLFTKLKIIKIQIKLIWEILRACPKEIRQSQGFWAIDVHFSVAYHGNGIEKFHNFHNCENDVYYIFFLQFSLSFLISLSIFLCSSFSFELMQSNLLRNIENYFHLFLIQHQNIGCKTKFSEC